MRFERLLVAIFCLASSISSLSAATECTEGFARNATFGEITAMELDFGERLVPNSSKCSASFTVKFSNMIDASCNICGKIAAVGDQLIGKRKVISKGMNAEYDSRFDRRPIYNYNIHLEEITPGNPLLLQCSADTIRGYDYNISDAREASMVLMALSYSKIKCTKPKVKRSCF